ncbi:MAG: oligopeptide/dipeptide ABC transporter ATP-binding protein [Paracoccaceae bacterium]
MLLDVNDLTVSFETNDGSVQAVNGVSFGLSARETLAIVGESGSGKSQTAFAIMGLLARNGRASGSVKFDGQELIGASDSEMNKIRAEKIAMIFQDPMTSLNPYMRISKQMEEVLVLHKGISKKEARAESIRMLDAVRIPEAKARITMYPHEFSGGMRQRVMIAIALLCGPKILIADEPTTALDVTVQAQIMEVLADIRCDFGTGIILITHDLGVVAGFCDRTQVMYGGKLMEAGATADLFSRPSHPYTKGLLSAVPRLDRHEDHLRTIAGDPPDMSDLPTGCPFQPRCAQRLDICARLQPELISSDNRLRACHLPEGQL